VKEMIKIKFIRTFYPHWGKGSGIHQFIQHLPTERFNINEVAVPMRANFFWGRGLNKLFIKFSKKEEIETYYQINDATEEIQTYFQCLMGKYDIVHFLDGEHGLMFLPSMLERTKWVRKKPILVGMFHQPPDILDRLIKPKIARKLDYITVVAPDQEDWFSRFMPRNKIRTILHGVSINHFIPMEKKGDSEGIRCLACGFWLRDYDALFETARLLKNYPNIEFHIITSNLKKPTDLNNVFIHQKISDKQYLSLFQKSDVLFMPLKEATANNVILEGIACGLPVVTTDLKSVRTYLSDEEAFLIENNNPLSFAKALSELSKNFTRRTEMGKLARKRALQLSWERIGKEYESYYKELCSCKQGEGHIGD
jgi:glycosyltransferase involved in cell wall biosynthesis